MKKKLINTFVCILLLATTISVGTPVKNIEPNTTTPSQSLTSMTKMATKVPTVGSLKNNLIPVMVPSKSIQSNGLASWKQQAKLLASDGAEEDFFSSLGISLSGDTALIGAWGDDDNGVDSGSAYVFIRTGTTWTEEAKLLASDGAGGDAFGWCAAIEGDTALIGAAGDDMLKGSAYVFTRSGTTWTEQAKLFASDGAAGDQFGYSVYLSGDTAIIGANCDDDNGFDSGSAYVFTRTNNAWTQQTKLLAPDGATLDSFGGEVSISGDTALIGSCFDDDNGSDSGSAYVFIRTVTTWTKQAKLRASDGATGDYFSAYAVSISNDTALIGAGGDDDNGADSGSAYVFTRTGTTWTEQAKLLPLNGAAQDFFGGSVSLSGDTMLIGAGGDNDNGNDAGSAYVFIRTNTTWTQEAKLLASDGSAGDVFGWDVALDGNTAIIGAYYDDDNGADSGSTYIFIKENEPPVADFSWTPQKPHYNQPISFDASASYDPDGIITTFEWDWNNDGVYEESHTTSTTTHSWANPGSYPVTVRATDDDSATGTITKTINVSEINLEIDIQGGLGVKMVITNSGTSDVTGIAWQIHVQGGILGRINKTANGTIDIPAEGTLSVGKLMLFGFGLITITARVADEEKTTGGFLFLFFVIGVK